jgi:hypothetical protein
LTIPFWEEYNIKEIIDGLVFMVTEEAKEQLEEEKTLYEE